MANRDLLREAIADAKSVKETAIANAKAALEEAFTPQLRSMLATKLAEMEKEDEMDEAKAHDEMDEAQDKDDMHEMSHDDELDEILASLDEGMEDDEMNEDAPNLAGKGKGKNPKGSGYMQESEDDEMNEDAPISAGKGKGKNPKGSGYMQEAEGEDADVDVDAEEEDMDLDLDSMGEDDLKDFIKDVLEDLISSGELDAGDGEAGMDDVDMSMDDEEVEMEDDMMEWDSESFSNGPNASVRETKALRENVMAKAKQAEKQGLLMKLFGVNSVGELMQALGGAAGAATNVGSGMREKKEMEKDLHEAYSTVKTLRKELNEVNLLNAKLLYSNRIFKDTTLSESQKVKVLSTFDKASNVKEVKLVYETLKNSVGKKSSTKSTIKESLGGASRAAGTSTRKQRIVETNDMAARFQKLAGLK